MDRLLSSKELSQLLNITQLSVTRLAQRGAIPAKKIGNRYRFDLEEVKNALESTNYTDPAAQNVEVKESIDSLRGEIAELNQSIRVLAGGGR